jgi:hypothetical protein
MTGLVGLQRAEAPLIEGGCAGGGKLIEGYLGASP